MGTYGNIWKTQSAAKNTETAETAWKIKKWRDVLLRRKFRDDDVIRPDEYVDICPNCGTLFNPNPTGRRKKFCSDECRLAWNHKHPRPERWKDTSRTAICPVCNKEFVVTREYKVKRKYCSRTCANKGRSGRSKTNGNKSCAT